MYIADVLCNKEAANNLVNEVESAILERLNNPESFEPYHPLKERKYPYYRIYVKNYTIYYVVIPNGDNKKIMEVRRMLHNLQRNS
jgi:plasmid stabilization system protein ParE